MTDQQRGSLVVRKSVHRMLLAGMFVIFLANVALARSPTDQVYRVNFDRARGIIQVDMWSGIDQSGTKVVFTAQSQYIMNYYQGAADQQRARFAFLSWDMDKGLSVPHMFVEFASGAFNLLVTALLQL